MPKSPFALTAPLLIDNGYSPMPIAPRCEPLFEGHRPPNGKEPGRRELRANSEERWVRIKGWTAFCTRQAHPATIARWSRMPDAGVCVATGFNNLVAVDIDRDDLIADVLAVLPAALVGKVGKRGATYFFRSADPMPSTAYKDSEKRGLLDFLSGGKQSVIPGTIHPDLGEPYRWLTPATLLNTPLESLPLFTDEHRTAMEEVLRAHGWDAPEPRVVPRCEVVEKPVRAQSAESCGSRWWNGFREAVNAAMPQWLPKVGLYKLERQSGCWRAVAGFRPSGSGTPLEKRERNLAIYDSGRIKDYSGPRDHNAISLVAACLFGSRENTKPAIAWLCEESGYHGEPDVIEQPAAPTYEDNRVPLDEALKPLADVFGDGFKDAILASRAARVARAAYDALDDTDPAHRKKILIPYDHPVEIVPTETGVGKTHVARKALTPLTKLGMKFVYAVPTHELAEEVAADFRLEGASVEVYRAYDRQDPRSKKHLMCRRPDAFKAVRKLGIAPHNAICERREGSVAIRCHKNSRCGLMRQRKATPDIWIVPSSLLFTPMPVFFPEIDALVIDEGFIDNALGDPFKIDVQALHDTPIDGDYSPEERDAITRFRQRLRDAARDNGNGPLSRAALLDQEIDCAKADWLSKLEHRPLFAADLSPEMAEREIKANAKKLKAKANAARNASTMWHEISTFLGEGDFGGDEFYGPRTLSGRLTVEGSTILVKPFRTVHSSWRDAPLAYLDATPPTTRLIEIVLGEVPLYGLPSVVRRQPEITAEWSPHVRVRQIFGGPSTMSSVDVGSYAKKKREAQPGNSKKEASRRSNDEIIDYIRLQVALARPGRVGVITFKELRERTAGKLPDTVRWAHFNSVAGLNAMKEVSTLIVLGRQAATRRAVEADASVFAGYPVTGDSDLFELVTGGIRVADGSVASGRMERHPDPIAEALRWLITEGQLIQAIGRLRPHRRDAPCRLDIITDVPLPIVVNEKVQWGDVKPGAVGAMALQGVILTNVSDAQRAFGLKEWVARGVGGFSKGNLPVRETTESSPVRKFTYQKDGQGQKPCEGFMLPDIIGGQEALRTWLEAKLGPLAAPPQVEMVRVRDLLKTEAGRAILAKAWRGSPLNRTTQTVTAMIAQLRRPLMILQEMMEAGELEGDEQDADETPAI